MPISLVYNKYTYLALYITHVNIQVRLSMFIFSMGLLHKVENSMGSKQSICIYIYKCTLYRNVCFFALFKTQCQPTTCLVPLVTQRCVCKCPAYNRSSELFSMLPGGFAQLLPSSCDLLRRMANRSQDWNTCQ